MKKLLKKSLSICMSVALMLILVVIGSTQASALSTNDYYNTYSTVANIGDRSSCSSMQGMAVGSTYLYTVKTKGNNSSAVLQKTNKSTGATTKLTDSNGSATYSYLNHANDMDVTTIDGYSQLYIATMATGSNSLVRMKINGSKATKSGSYTIMLNGAQKSVSAVSIEGTTSTTVNFLFKVGTQVYRGSVAKSATSGTINITPAFTINTSSVRVNGSYLNLSSYTHQGMGYYDGKIYVPLWGGSAGKSNQAIIAVYDTYNASGTITSDPYLSFRITSGAYSGFEIETCDVSSDGQLYFNVNRWTSRNGNQDAILRFNGYVANGFDPNGYVDAVSGGTGSVYVRGWAFDKDCIRQAIGIHIYIGGEFHGIDANTLRTDVNSAFLCGNNHGFEATINTSKIGLQSYQIYAINSRKGNNILIGSGTVNIVPTAGVVYSGHVQNYGDVAPVSNWETLGTVGQSLRLEGVRMYINGMGGDVQYRVHVQNYGWMDWKSANAYAGTTGQGLRIEAIQIKLTGDIANYYNVEYQAHVQNNGWMAVTSNGGTAGTTGQSLRVEALRIRLVRK